MKYAPTVILLAFLSIAGCDSDPGESEPDAAVPMDGGIDAGTVDADAAMDGGRPIDAGGQDAGVPGDPCMVDNGGCGDATYYECRDDEGVAVCSDIDECAMDNGGCGDAAYYACTNNEGGAPTCADIDECAMDNGGCGDVAYYACTNNEGSAPTCADIDDCPAPDPCSNGGSCIDGLGSYTCDCAAGWTGATCDTNACDGVTCNGHGRCAGTDHGSRWECFCDPAWSGTTCQTCHDNTCDTRPGYYADRYVHCRESIGQDDGYCSSWMGCHGAIFVNGTYGTVTGTAISDCR